MNKIVLLLFLLNFTYAIDCFSSWHKENFDSKNNFYIISGSINKENNFKLFINNNQNNQKYKIEMFDKVVIGDKDKVSSYLISKNQLIIEKTDSLFNDFIFLFYIY